MNDINDMSDRELLEQAAKACGYDTSHPWNAERLTLDPPVASLYIGGRSTAWNPLQDNGHALILAVDLRINIIFDGFLAAESVCARPPTHISNLEWHEPIAYDARDSARRAIVMAAAAMAAND